MKTLVLASNNPGKIREIRARFGELGIEVMPQAHYGIEEVEEPHVTFLENALAKARHAAQRTGLPALADDSGICVQALQGAPGVHSARFAGEPRSDARNNVRLLDALAGVSDRRAHYYCVLVLLRHALDPQPLIAEGEWQGEILHAPRGDGGFGYDPLFLDPRLGRSGAELPLEEKHAVSHRGKALRALFERVRREQ
ncbi:MAG: RdgB/HAM1 family non-canonical purine NTP pyrophosphatase [Burkholderiales bacterium]|nr:RdgB/HAM1 family non-canonical purine NTP pyrophosphatase [Burkholderiales bacterium]